MPEGFDDTAAPDTLEKSESEEFDVEGGADDEEVNEAPLAPPAQAEAAQTRKTTDPDALSVIREEVQNELRHRTAG